jgi:hypothetical protein
LKTKIFASLFCFAFFMSYYIYQSEKQPQKASRALASVPQGFDFLSKAELKLLTPKEQKNYLNKISQAIVKAGVFKGVFRDQSKKKVSLNKPFTSPFSSPEFSLGVSKAYAAYRCAMYGLHPYVRNNEADCSVLEKRPTAIKISASSIPSFIADGVELGSSRDDEQNILKCPDNQYMCNPALIGFDFEDGKARLRCLDDASNANCYKLRTNADQMGKSLELIETANPRYWDEFSNGIEEQCLVDGKFNEADEGCVYVKKQISYSTRNYRSKLTQKYLDLASKLEEQTTVDAADKKVCKQFTKTDSEMSLADHENFNAPGFKILYKRGQCWRVPSRTIVTRSNDQFSLLLPEGTTASEDPILTPEIGGVGSDPNRVSDVRFYNFKCGPCNDAESLSACVFNMRKPAADRNFSSTANDRAMLIGPDDCRALIGQLETAELPDVVFEKAQQQGTPFHQSGAID